jgi:hypothetical protein
MADERLEFALLAWRDDGRWRISQLPDDATTDIGVVLDALRAQQVDGGALAMLAIDDQFFLELSDIESPEEDDADEPAGDLNIFTDLGLDAMELQMICDDDEMFPDEQLEVIARRIGFGDEYIDLVEKL